MRLEYKKFDFTETLREIDETLLPEHENLIPKNQFLPSSNNSNNTECAFAGVIAVNVRMRAYDNGNFSALQRAYDIVKQVLLDIFRDNSDCIDTICIGRYLCGIYNTPVTTNVNELIVTMAKLNAALSVLDLKLYKRFNIHIQGNCGCDYGELFRVQTFYNKALYETWHGAALNMAILYAEHDIINDKNGTIVSETIKSNLKEEFAKFFSEYKNDLCGYWTSLVDSEMYEWIKANR